MTGGGDRGHVRKGRGGGFGGADLVERDHLEHLIVDGKIILKWSFNKWDGEAGTVLLWLMKRRNGGHLSMR
jgi:hypothetical protein